MTLYGPFARKAYVDAQVAANADEELPTSVSVDDFDAVAGAQINAADATTDWNVASPFAALALDTTTKNEGTGSVGATLHISSAGGKLYYEPASAITPGDNKYIALDLYLSEDGPTLPESIGYYLEVQASEGSGLTGTTVSVALNEPATDEWFTVYIPIASLSSVASVGVAAVNFDSGNTYRILGKIDNLRWPDQSELDLAIASSPDPLTVIVPASYEATYNVVRRSLDDTKSVLDFRPGHENYSRFRGVRHVRDLGIATDGSREVSVELQNLLHDARPGDVIQLGPGKLWCESSVTLRGVKDVIVDARGAHIFRRSLPSKVHQHSIRIIGCERVAILEGSVYGYRVDAFDGSEATDVSGSAVSGTTRVLDAQNDQCRIATEGDDTSVGNGFYAFYLKEQYPDDVQALIEAQDPDFFRGSVFEMMLSDSAQVASDCMLLALAQIFEGYTATEHTTGAALDSSQTSIVGLLDPHLCRVGDTVQIENEHIYLSDFDHSTDTWSITRGRNGTTAAAHTAGQDVYRVLATRTLTLTGSATPYILIVQPRERREKYFVRVRKMTGTANTITLASYRTWGVSDYTTADPDGVGGGFQLAENHSAVSISQSQDIALLDMEYEGPLTDGVQVSYSEPASRRVLVRRPRVFGACRQGLSFNDGIDIEIVGARIVGSARSHIDLEPFVSDWLVRGLRIVDMEGYHATNGGIAAVNEQNVGAEIDGVRLYRTGASAPIIFGGSSARIRNVYTEGTGSAGVSLSLTGTDLEVSDCQLDAPPSLPAGSSGVLRDVRYEGGDLSVEDGSEWTLDNVRGARFVPDSSIVFRGKDTYLSGLSVSGWNSEQHRAKYPRSHPGPVVKPAAWSPGGMSIGGEPIIDLAGLTGSRPQTGTLLTSASRSVSADGAAVDLAGGESGAKTVGRIRVRVHAPTVGSGATLDATLQGSHDNSHWFDLGAIAQITTASGDDPAAEWITANCPRYVRLSYTLAGGSVTFESDYEFWGAGNNLVLAQHSLGASATSVAVTFPSVVQPTAVLDSATAAQDASGALTAATYFYKIGLRGARRGPYAWSTERSVVVDGSSTNAVNLNHKWWARRDSRAKGMWLTGVTILRGTSSGVYDTRYDIYSAADLIRIRSDNCVIRDLGASVTRPTSTEWPSVVLADAESGSWSAEDESGWEPDAQYAVGVLGLNWNAGGWWVTDQTREGFTLNFASAAPGDGSGRVTPYILR